MGHTCRGAANRTCIVTLSFSALKTYSKFSVCFYSENHTKHIQGVGERWHFKVKKVLHIHDVSVLLGQSLGVNSTHLNEKKRVYISVCPRTLPSQGTEQPQSFVMVLWKRIHPEVLQWKVKRHFSNTSFCGCQTIRNRRSIFEKIAKIIVQTGP
jgi:hypothetical protein